MAGNGGLSRVETYPSIHVPKRKIQIAVFELDQCRIALIIIQVVTVFVLGHQHHVRPTGRINRRAEIAARVEARVRLLADSPLMSPALDGINAVADGTPVVWHQRDGKGLHISRVTSNPVEVTTILGVK